MTSEEQLRAALLGGGQLTTMLASPRRSMGTLLAQQEEASSLHARQVEFCLPKSSNDIWVFDLGSTAIFQRPEKTQRALGGAYEVEGATLLRDSQDAQWQSLRVNVLKRLEGLYAFRERSKVKSFLERNLFLVLLLLQASDKIREFFGSATVVLEVSTDPDDGDYQELWARIQTKTAPTDALSTLTRFDEDWWLDASASSHDLLNIKLEYV